MGLKEKKGPLRRVLFRAMLPVDDDEIRTSARQGRAPVEIPFEVYECGHKAVQKSDIIGPTNAARRRCRQCRDGKPPSASLKADADAFLARERRETTP